MYIIAHLNLDINNKIRKIAQSPGEDFLCTRYVESRLIAPEAREETVLRRRMTLLGV